MKKLFSLLAAVSLVAGGLFATATPAQAEEGVTDITVAGDFVVKDLVISSKGCRPIGISLDFEADPQDAAFDEVQAGIWVWGGKVSAKNAVEEYLFAGGVDRVLTNTVVFKPIEWCPTKPKNDYSVWGLGKFTVEGEYLVWWDLGTEEEATPNGGLDLYKSATFTVKQASKAASAKASKKGTKRTLSAKFTYFDVSKKAWKSMPKGTKVELQRRAANGTGAWKKIKTVKVGAKGAVKTTYKTKSTYQYRFVYTGNSTKAPAISKALKK